MGQLMKSAVGAGVMFSSLPREASFLTLAPLPIKPKSNQGHPSTHLLSDLLFFKHINSSVEPNNLFDVLPLMEPTHSRTYSIKAGTYLRKQNDIDESIDDEWRSWI